LRAGLVRRGSSRPSIGSASPCWPRCPACWRCSRLHLESAARPGGSRIWPLTWTAKRLGSAALVALPRCASAFGLKFWALISGGGALPAPLEQFWNAVGLVLVQGYGMTETTALITLNHPFHVARGTIGKPLAGARGQARPRRRGAGARRIHLRRYVVGWRAACAPR
jgi:hypothetical protein